MCVRVYYILYGIRVTLYIATAAAWEASAACDCNSGAIHATLHPHHKMMMRASFVYYTLNIIWDARGREREREWGESWCVFNIRTFDTRAYAWCADPLFYDEILYEDKKTYRGYYVICDDIMRRAMCMHLSFTDALYVTQHRSILCILNIRRRMNFEENSREFVNFHCLTR